MRARVHAFRIGLFVLAGIACAVGFVLFLAARTSKRDTAAYVTYFDESINGLEVGAPVKLRGVVTKVQLVNPHSWIHIDVKDADGKVTSWAIEGGTPNTLFRLGINKNSLAIGTELLVDGYRAKDGSFSSGPNQFASLNSTYEVKFTQTGKTILYYCQVHGACCQMQGSVRVGAEAPPPDPGY